MRLQMTGRHMDLPESLKAFAQEKVGRLERYCDGVTKAQLVLSPDFVARASARRNSRDAGGAGSDGASALPQGSEETAAGDEASQGARAESPSDGPHTEPAGRTRGASAASGYLVHAELVLAVRRERAPFVARARGETCQAAIDMVVDKMERQLCRHKEKLRDRRQPRRSRSGGA